MENGVDMIKNYYKILMIAPEAPQEMVVKAYRVLARGYHPDRNPPGRQRWAEEKMKELNEAYEVLSNPVKRSEYDRKLRRQETRAESSRHEPTTPEQPAAAETGHVITGDTELDWSTWGRDFFDHKEDFVSAVYPAPLAKTKESCRKGKRGTSWWRRRKKTGTELIRRK
jgi:DnaJ-class molecular chaperone